MKFSGKKICIGLSAIVVVLMLLIPGLNAKYLQSNPMNEFEVIDSNVISSKDCIQTDSSVGLSIGMEILQSL